MLGRRRRFLLTFGAVAVLSACGKKGPLELPPAEPVLDDERPDGDPQ
ncbi:MAG: LPS translocon maturation chaperone LptM [Geminicoccaceae bacterium]